MSTPAQAARDARRELARQARPVGAFDASRYFRGDSGLGFYNVGTPRVRAMARAIYRAHRDVWTVEDALTCADALMRDRFLESKSVGIELVAQYRREFASRLLPAWKRWLAEGQASNWATTDAICGYLIGPLLAARPELIGRVATWARHRNLWVRRASAVSLIPSVRRGLALDAAYGVATTLRGDEADLIQKAAGWLLREAGKRDMRRLETYLRANGRSIPRTTVRYAVERFDDPKRRTLMAATRATGRRAAMRTNEGGSARRHPG